MFLKATKPKDEQGESGGHEHGGGRTWMDWTLLILAIASIGGRVVIEDGSGSITIDDVGGDVRIDDGSGSIEVTGVAGTVSVSDGSGGITVRDAADFELLEDGSGSVDLEGIRSRSGSD